MGRAILLLILPGRDIHVYFQPFKHCSYVINELNPQSLTKIVIEAGDKKSNSRLFRAWILLDPIPDKYGQPMSVVYT